MTSIIRGSDNFDSSEIFGVGQSWQNVLGSRASNVTYNNTTGRPIMVSVNGAAGALSSSVSMYVDGVLVAKTITADPTNGSTLGLTYVVPDGSSYKVVTNGAPSLWFELR